MHRDPTPLPSSPVRPRSVQSRPVQSRRVPSSAVQSRPAPSRPVWDALGQMYRNPETARRNRDGKERPQCGDMVLTHVDECSRLELLFFKLGSLVFFCWSPLPPPVKTKLFLGCLKSQNIQGEKGFGGGEGRGRTNQQQRIPSTTHLIAQQDSKNARRLAPRGQVFG